MGRDEAGSDGADARHRGRLARGCRLPRQAHDPAELAGHMVVVGTTVLGVRGLDAKGARMGYGPGSGVGHGHEPDRRQLE